MQKQKIKFNIVLSGFMASGKTTIGKQLSFLTNIKFVDTDKYIETITGKKIRTIFDVYGEKYFRHIEKICIKNITNEFSPLIISTGGGTLLDSENVFYLKQNGKIFFLHAPFNIILSRLKFDSSRPLAKNNNFIKKLFVERKNLYYSTSDFFIDANQSINEICKNILNKIK